MPSYSKNWKGKSSFMMTTTNNSHNFYVSIGGSCSERSSKLHQKKLPDIAVISPRTVEDMSPQITSGIRTVTHIDNTRSLSFAPIFVVFIKWKKFKAGPYLCRFPFMLPTVHIDRLLCQGFTIITALQALI